LLAAHAAAMLTIAATRPLSSGLSRSDHPDRRATPVPPASPENEGKVLVVRLGEIVLIHDLKRQGLSVSAIARQLGLDRKTQANLPPGNPARFTVARIDPIGLHRPGAGVDHAP
jgi:hypothetical protein